LHATGGGTTHENGQIIFTPVHCAVHAAPLALQVDAAITVEGQLAQ
jgi:hypothetical protein